MINKIQSIPYIPNKLPKGSLSHKCGYWAAARAQRRAENDRGLGNEGTMGFENKGCYECNGHRYQCESYFSPLKEYNKGLEGKTK